MTISIFTQLILTIGIAICFSIMLKVPPKHIPLSVLTGCLGWTCYHIVTSAQGDPTLACFLSAAVIEFFSNIFARVFKCASTVFTIPGIIFLVPGTKVFSTMTAMLNSDLNSSVSLGIEALLLAGSIALGLLVVGAAINLVKRIIEQD